MAKLKRRSRINSADSAGFPVGQMIPVEAIRLNEDQTISIVVNDEDLPASLRHDIGEAPNRGRRNSRKSKGKKSNRKR